MKEALARIACANRYDLGLGSWVLGRPAGEPAVVILAGEMFILGL